MSNGTVEIVATGSDETIKNLLAGVTKTSRAAVADIKITEEAGRN